MIAGWTLALLLGPPEASAGEPEPSTPTPAAEQAPPPTLDPALVAAVLADLPGPTLAEVQRAALRQAGVDTRSRRTLRRARAAAAAPRVSVQFDHRFDRGWVLDQEAGTSDALRNDSGAQETIRIDATWELDRLIFSPDELRVTRSALDLADWRQRTLVEVTQLHFERQRLMVEERLAPAVDLDTAIARAVRIAEIEGLLAGMTGLDFGP